MKTSCICKWVFITDGRVDSLYFTSEVTGRLQSDFSAANLGLNQYSLSNHLQEKGLAHSGGTPAERRRRGRKQSIQQHRSGCGGGGLTVNTGEGGELGSWDRDGGAAAARDQSDLKAAALLFFPLWIRENFVPVKQATADPKQMQICTVPASRNDVKQII